jgi:hypothetical protein
MIPQNDQLNNFSRKPLEQGGQEEGFPGPEGNPLKTTPGNDGTLAPERRGSVRRLHTNELERLHGRSKGGNHAVEEELRRRGFNSKMLAEIEWEYGQRQWCKAAKKASKISTAKNAEARRSRLKRKRARRRERSRERLRQNRIDLLARLKEGIVIVGENYDPAAADGTCPF